MGRGKHCIGEKSDLIKQFILVGNIYKEVGQLVGYSNKMNKNAIKYEEKELNTWTKTIYDPSSCQKNDSSEQEGSLYACYRA